MTFNANLVLYGYSLELKNGFGKYDPAFSKKHFFRVTLYILSPKFKRLLCKKLHIRRKYKKNKTITSYFSSYFMLPMRRKKSLWSYKIA